MEEVTLTKSQVDVGNQILWWLGHGHQAVVLGGYAGTGKTCLTIELVKALNSETGREVVVTAPTNKAAAVLRDKAAIAGEQNATYATIHSVLGLEPTADMDKGTGRLMLRRVRKPRVPRGALLVVDECSMVGRELLQFILDEAMKQNTQVLFVGDPAQLPPVMERDSPVFGLVENQALLTEIVRQAQGNPILDLADGFRKTLEGHPFPRVDLHSSPEAMVDKDFRGVACYEQSDFEDALIAAFKSGHYEKDLDYCRVLTWTNGRNRYYNTLVRRALMGEVADREEIIRGERLVSCRSVAVYGKQIPIGTVVSVLNCSRFVDGYGIEIYRVTPDKYPHGHLDVPTKSGWIRYKEVAKGLASHAQALQAEKKLAGAHYPMVKEKLRRQAWRDFFAFSEQYADLRPPYACTIHKSQGSTYDHAFLDLTDIGRNTKWWEISKLMYVALTRPRNGVVTTGELPGRLYLESVCTMGLDSAETESGVITNE